MSKHNKKRNVGIIYELLLRQISASMIDDNRDHHQKALRILQRHFRRDTELYKEFRLFNALVKTAVSNPYTAGTIISEARTAAAKIDPEKLSEEKTRLIHSINHSFNRDDFYFRHVPDYRMYATIQTLLDSWRTPVEHRDIPRIAEYEEKVHGWLLKEKVEDSLINHKTENVDKLVVKLMQEKLEKKYRDALNEEQKEILRKYTLFFEKKDHGELRTHLEKLLSETLGHLNEYLEDENNAYLNEHATHVLSEMRTLDPGNINDQTIAQFLTVAQLKKTLGEEDTR